MTDDIKVEVCNPDFEDEFFISFIRSLDKSKVYNLDSYMSIHNMMYALNATGSNKNIGFDEIKFIPEKSYVDIGEIIELDDIIDCNYNTYYKIFKMSNAPLVDFNKVHNSINYKNNTFRLGFLPDMKLGETVLTFVKDYHVSLPYSIFLTMVILTVSCVKNRNVKFFEIYPRLDGEEKYVEMHIEFSYKTGRSKCEVNQAHTPFLTITGFRKPKGLFAR